jgi:signal transduction histidine kinase
LSNALKFTPNNGKIIVRFEAIDFLNLHQRNSNVELGERSDVHLVRKSKEESKRNFDNGFEKSGQQ